MGVSGGAVTTLMIGTTVASGWGTGEVGGGGGGGETIVGTTPTESGRGEGGDATITVGGETKVMVEVVTLG